MGDRQFGRNPMYVHRRANWEFFAVVRGRCGCLLRGGESAPLLARRLWIFPPDVPHGWSGSPNRGCRVVSFHFAAVPDLMERAVKRDRVLSLPLTAEQCRWIWRLAVDLKPHYHRSTERSSLLFQRALIDLSLFVLEATPMERADPGHGDGLQKVEASQAWYAEHMAEQPKLGAVAAAVSVSSRHLRRLFNQVRGETPQVAFTRLRVQRAVELLSQSNRKLEAIAAACGFSSSSDFCRVFRAHRGISPDAWRRRMLKECEGEQAGKS